MEKIKKIKNLSRNSYIKEFKKFNCLCENRQLEFYKLLDSGKDKELLLFFNNLKKDLSPDGCWEFFSKNFSFLRKQRPFLGISICNFLADSMYEKRRCDLTINFLECLSQLYSDFHLYKESINILKNSLYLTVIEEKIIDIFLKISKQYEKIDKNKAKFYKDLSYLIANKSNCVDYKRPIIDSGFARFLAYPERFLSDKLFFLYFVNSYPNISAYVKAYFSKKKDFFSFNKITNYFKFLDCHNKRLFMKVDTFLDFNLPKIKKRKQFDEFLRLFISAKRLGFLNCIFSQKIDSYEEFKTYWSQFATEFFDLYDFGFGKDVKTFLSKEPHKFYSFLSFLNDRESYIFLKGVEQYINGRWKDWKYANMPAFWRREISSNVLIRDQSGELREYKFILTGDFYELFHIGEQFRTCQHYAWEGPEKIGLNGTVNNGWIKVALIKKEDTTYARVLLRLFKRNNNFVVYVGRIYGEDEFKNIIKFFLEREFSKLGVDLIYDDPGDLELLESKSAYFYSDVPINGARGLIKLVDGELHVCSLLPY